MDKEPLISVIVPVYNTQAYISACIQSILAQTHKNLELFLVDDGSTDGSLAVCQSYAEKDSRVIVLTKKNGGQGSARNMALDRISGEYISFVDSDDYIKPTMLEEMVKQIHLFDADIAICSISLVYENGRLLDRSLPHRKVYTNEELMREYVSTGNIHTGPCNKLYKRELFSALRFPEIKANEDAYIMHEILGKCKVAVHVGKGYYIQNVRGNSTEQKAFGEANLVLLEVARRLINYYADYYPELLDLVGYKEVNDVAALLQRILLTCSYWKNRKTYRQLVVRLQEEYRSARQQFPENSYITPLALEAVQHPLRFKLLNSLRGIKRKLLH